MAIFRKAGTKEGDFRKKDVRTGPYPIWAGEPLAFQKKMEKGRPGIQF